MAVGLTLNVPELVFVPVQPTVAVQEVVSVDDQVKVAELPLFIVVGATLKVTTGSGTQLVPEQTRPPEQLPAPLQPQTPPMHALPLGLVEQSIQLVPQCTGSVLVQAVQEFPLHHFPEMQLPQSKVPVPQPLSTEPHSLPTQAVSLVMGMQTHFPDGISQTSLVPQRVVADQ